MLLVLYHTTHPREHSCEKHLRWLAENEPPFPASGEALDPAEEPEEAQRPRKWVGLGLAPGMSRLPLAMPEDCWLPDACHAYRKYFVVHKSATMASWPGGEVPPWFEDHPADWVPLPRPSKKGDAGVGKQQKKSRGETTGVGGKQQKKSRGRTTGVGGKQQKKSRVKVERIQGLSVREMEERMAEAQAVEGPSRRTRSRDKGTGKRVADSVSVVQGEGEGEGEAVPLKRMKRE